jgi:hypothetical protein
VAPCALPHRALLSGPCSNHWWWGEPEVIRKDKKALSFQVRQQPPCFPSGRSAPRAWVADETCPVSTGRGTRRVQLVREGRGGGGGIPLLVLQALLQHRAPRLRRVAQACARGAGVTRPLSSQATIPARSLCRISSRGTTLDPSIKCLYKTTLNSSSERRFSQEILRRILLAELSGRGLYEGRDVSS